MNRLVFMVLTWIGLGATSATAGSFSALAPGGNSDDDRTSIYYGASTGELAVDVPGSVELTSINIDSTAGIFTGGPAVNLDGPLDHHDAYHIFKAVSEGSFGTISFGNVAQKGLSEDFVLGDLTVVGSVVGGGDLGIVDMCYLCDVPEPSVIALFILGVISLIPYRSRDRCDRGSKRFDGGHSRPWRPCPRPQ